MVAGLQQPEVGVRRICNDFDINFRPSFFPPLAPINAGSAVPRRVTYISQLDASC